MHILLIEDNEDDVVLLENELRDVHPDENVGRITHVQRLQDAGRYLKDGVIDMVLLDLGLQETQGIFTLERFRLICNDIPVVVLTGLDDEKLALRAIQLGAQDYLVKGQINRELLTRCIRYAVERHRLQSELQQTLNRERLERELKEELRGYLLTIDAADHSDPSDTPEPDEEAMKNLATEYEEIVSDFLRSGDGDEDYQKKIDTIAQKLAANRVTTRVILALHIQVMDHFVFGVSPVTCHVLTNRARMVLVEILGKILDNYRDDPRINSQAA